MSPAHLLVTCLITTTGATDPDILALLERDLQGKISPFLAGRHGSFYIGGQSLAQSNPLTSLWPVKENETLGFMHPFFRDGRARGIAITCDGEWAIVDGRSEDVSGRGVQVVVAYTCDNTIINTLQN